MRGWFLNVNNLAYREAPGGDASYDAYRVDLRTFWKHGGGHVPGGGQDNWLTSDAPSARQATVIPAVTSGAKPIAVHVVARSRRTLVVSRAMGRHPICRGGGVVRRGTVPLDRSVYPTVGAGVHFVIKPKERLNVNLEYAQGIGDSRGLYLELGYAW